VIPKLHSWPTPLQAFVFVAGPRLGLRHLTINSIFICVTTLYVHRCKFYKYYKITNLAFLNVKLKFVIILLFRYYHVLNINLTFICVKS
jgi:hypothetical protein